MKIEGLANLIIERSDYYQKCQTLYPGGKPVKEAFKDLRGKPGKKNRPGLCYKV